MSAIAKNASITMITATPGSGKTLRTVWYLKQALQQGEMVFQCNINGLDLPGVHQWDDPTEWEQLPPGSILAVDEAQTFFRAGMFELEEDQTGKMVKVVPKNIRAMETIRHKGIRLLLITQHPALIHANIRALTGLHEHLVRENGKKSAIIYRRHGAIIDNVRSHAALTREDKETWAYPTEVYDLYKSAEVHTVKRTFHSKTKRGYLMLLAAAALVGVVYYRIHGRLTDEQVDNAAKAETTMAPQGDESAAEPPRNGNREKPMVFTAEQYAKLYTPLIANAPWTAPAFTNREARAEPNLFCAVSGEVDVEAGTATGNCRCVTEQGTRYKVGRASCVDMAINGPMYNPFRQAERGDRYVSMGGPGQAFSVRGSRGAGGTPAAMDAQQAAAPLPSAITSGPTVSGYGAIRAGSGPTAP